MQLVVKMAFLFAVYFIANVLALFAVLSDARQQSCTANHCGEITKAIKTLETKWTISLRW